MKAQIILHDYTVDVELNEPVIEVMQKQDGMLINIIGGVGPQGNQGYSPVRGTDYWTAEDVEEIIHSTVEAVLDVYPAAEEVQW